MSMNTRNDCLVCSWNLQHRNTIGGIYFSTEWNNIIANLTYHTCSNNELYHLHYFTVIFACCLGPIMIIELLRPTSVWVATNIICHNCTRFWKNWINEAEEIIGLWLNLWIFLPSNVNQYEILKQRDYKQVSAFFNWSHISHWIYS